MKIQNVTDKEFQKYGRILTGYQVSELTEMLKKMELPQGVEYVASVPELESLPVSIQFEKVMYGELPIEVGYCMGHNTKLNGLEYHRSSEVNIAAEDMILLLGLQQDITDEFTYDTAKVEAFFVPAGTAVEMYATTLHSAPCEASEAGFRTIVILPAGTNAELDESHEGLDDDRLLAAKNKWLLAHPEAQIEGAVNGLKGENIDINN